MADLDDIKDGKDFPATKYPFYPERLRCAGLGNAVTLITDI